MRKFSRPNNCGTLMNVRNAIHTGTSRPRAEDDLFPFDQARAANMSGCDIGLFRSKTSAQYWVRSVHPRWLVSLSQPLVRPRSDG